jgi:hypothetical protein
MHKLQTIAALVMAASVGSPSPPLGAQVRPRPLVEGTDCRTITQKIVGATSARFDQFSELGTRVLFEHPSARDLSLSCTSPGKIGVYVRSDAAEPPAAFFDLATKAGVATTGELMSTLGMAIRNCHRAALQGRTEFAATETPMAKIECQAFTRQGGGTSVSVWVK